MGTIKVPLKLVGAYYDTAVIDSQRGDTEKSLLFLQNFGDDFNDDSIDPAKWTVIDSGGNINEINQHLEFDGSGSWTTNNLISLAQSLTGIVDVYFKLRFSTETGHTMFGVASGNAAGYGTNFATIYFATGVIYGSVAAAYTGGTFAANTTYEIRLVRFNVNRTMLLIKGGIYTEWTCLLLATSTWSNPYYFKLIQHSNVAAPHWIDDFSIRTSYPSTSPIIYTKYDSGSATTAWDMSTFANRGDNLNSETGNVKHKYFMSDTSYDVTNAGDRATIDAGLNGAWLTEAQMQAEADQAGQYAYIVFQLNGDGSQDCSQQEAADMIDVILAADIPAVGNVRDTDTVGGVPGTLSSNKILKSNATGDGAGNYDDDNLAVGNVRPVAFGLGLTGDLSNLIATDAAYIALEEARNNDNGTVAADILIGNSVKIRNSTLEGELVAGGGGIPTFGGRFSRRT